MRKPTTSDGFWSSSPCDLDNSTIQSQRSISSVSTLNQILYQSNGASTPGTEPEFVNQGLHLWNESRLQWVGRGLSEKQNQQKQESRLNSSRPFVLSCLSEFLPCEWLINHCVCCSRNATYESLLGTRQPFPKSVPLSEMVEFLVDVWEREGMYG
ncbi:uncharacterized protein [Medicago truncatula]|nr:uncharacterized protein LOC11441654 isoform X3 [Medicago truncatula]